MRFSAITVKEVFLDWAFTFMSTYLYYEDRDILDENGLNLYRKSLACFEGNAPTYHRALREHPVIVWDFHSLMLTVKFMFSVKLTDAKNPTRALVANFPEGRRSTSIPLISSEQHLFCTAI